MKVESIITRRCLLSPKMIICVEHHDASNSQRDLTSVHRGPVYIKITEIVSVI
ncbi:unnamed protein product [Nezara viridula]|uniref:Uncharacterized protein n=1 Tax=Nezara viridula TaxID=85310 RepID=A0A9P0HDM6_NEZVI|nr:unnamed protein product [Nezara viridula]